MSDNIKDVIAKNLLFYRKKNKITQKKLAEKLGVKHNAISSWKNGVNSIDIDTLFRVCQIFGITVNDMYGMSNDNKLPLSPHTSMVTNIQKMNLTKSASSLNLLKTNVNKLPCRRCPYEYI